MTKVSIIGAGIGGPVLALALQDIGVEASVYEEHPVAADGVGSFMNIAPNGLQAVEGIGLADYIRNVGFFTPAMAFYNRNGRRLTGDIPFDAKGGTGNTTLMRSDLYRALRDKVLERNIPVHYGKRFVDAEQHGDVITTKFADGTSEDSDLVVGADGLYSRVRQYVDPLAATPRYLGVLNAWGFVPEYKITEAPGVIRMYFNRKCFFMLTQAPSGDLYWYANPVYPKRPFVDELPDGEEWRRTLLAMVEKEGSPARDIIRATPQMVRPFTNCDMPEVARWRRRRAVLMGDAAHAASPTSGSGASVAIEDAVTLAKCLRDEKSIEVALAVYEQNRRPRAESIVAQGAKNVRGNTAGPIGSLFRDALIRRKFSGRDQPLWTHQHKIEWDSPTKSTV